MSQGQQQWVMSMKVAMSKRAHHRPHQAATAVGRLLSNLIRSSGWHTFIEAAVALNTLVMMCNSWGMDGWQRRVVDGRHRAVVVEGRRDASSGTTLEGASERLCKCVTGSRAPSEADERAEKRRQHECWTQTHERSETIGERTARIQAHDSDPHAPVAGATATV